MHPFSFFFTRPQSINADFEFWVYFFQRLKDIFCENFVSIPRHTPTNLVCKKIFLWACLDTKKCISQFPLLHLLLTRCWLLIIESIITIMILIACWWLDPLGGQPLINHVLVCSTVTRKLSTLRFDTRAALNGLEWVALLCLTPSPYQLRLKDRVWWRGAHLVSFDWT